MAKLPKVCSVCNIKKSALDFYTGRNGKLRSFCKKCHSEKAKKYREENKEKIAEHGKDYRSKNKTACSLRGKNYYLKNKEHHNKITKKHYEENKEHIISKQKERIQKDHRKYLDWHKAHYQKNKKEIRKKQHEYNKKRLKHDLSYRIRLNQGRRIRRALKNTGEVKNKSTLEYLGCSIEFLKGYLESQFSYGMNWGEFHKGKIHIDHIKPCASFDLSNRDDQLECFNYKNLQPLWDWENLEKGAKLDYTRKNMAPVKNKAAK